MARERIARWLAVVVTAAVPVVVWPGVRQPFSTPKRYLLLCGALAVAATTWRAVRFNSIRPRHATALGLTPIIWLASWIVPSLFGDITSFDALLTAVGGGLWGLALMASRPRSRDVAIAAVLGGTAVGAIAVAQWSGHDPFALVGWQPAIEGASVRMRVYATLGNPNFVAALLAAIVPLTVAIGVDAEGRPPRPWIAVALFIQLSAIVATGSRAGALGLVAAALAWVAVRRHRQLLVLATALIAGLVAVWLSEGRPLGDTIAGRQYIWSVVAPQALSRPLIGFGPGGVEAHYREWEHARRSSSAATGRPTRFAGPQQHAHNDYLEALLERGVPGLLGLVVVLLIPLNAAMSRASLRTVNLRAGSAGTIAALAAVAIVDNPLTRPAELMLLWSAIGILYEE
jgi:putative inorganic carbon (HCO3(-)) transporter